MERLGPILALLATLSFFLLSAENCRITTAAPSEEKTKRAEFEIPHSPASTLTQSEQRGANLYAYYCAVCHGSKGEGDGFNSFQLATPPSKHADPALMSKLSDADIAKVIKKGGGALGLSPEMAPWGRVFNDRDVADLVAFIRMLSRK